MGEQPGRTMSGAGRRSTTGALGGTTGSPGGATNAGGTTTTGGTTASGGSSGSGGASNSGSVATDGGMPPSCSGLAATCGPSGNESCCTSLLVPGGAFYRGYDGVDFTNRSFPATVADFYLDKYEITVGRFRAFVNAGMGTQANPPASGAGTNPLLTGSGWDSTWNKNLRKDTASLKTAVACENRHQTWTDTAGSNESDPMNCLDWYTAFAFCAWDGGRLPTEAEWLYAASGGSEQRYYPWSSPPTSTTVDDSYAVYCGGSCKIQNVGSKSPRGDGKWGQADLAGNLLEWVLDWYTSPYPTPCIDCADVAAGSYRVARGGYFDGEALDLHSSSDSTRATFAPDALLDWTGSRCARTPNR